MTRVYAPPDCICSTTHSKISFTSSSVLIAPNATFGAGGGTSKSLILTLVSPLILIDFASGLTYALDGGMQRIADKVFLLTPRNVEVSAEERARLIEKGFFNQS